MKIQCEYCGRFLSDTDAKCPNCGATNPHLQRSAEGVPKTLEELRAFCAEKHLPLQKMRFFLGEDIHEPRAFGIYQDPSGKFVVYKNKADGSRAVRYTGYDEAYAVNEIYQKMRSEIQNQRERRSETSRRGGRGSGNDGKNRIVAIAVALCLCASVYVGWREHRARPSTGYYLVEDVYYYYGGANWYLYDDADSAWIPAALDDGADLLDDAAGYYLASSYDDDILPEDFADSSYADQEREAAESNWDDDDWDWGDSWDSDFTDWDSDW